MQLWSWSKMSYDIPGTTPAACYHVIHSDLNWKLFLFDQTNIFVLTTTNTTTSTTGGLNINTKPRWHLHFLIAMNTFHNLQHKPKAVSDKWLHLNSLWITRISQKPLWKPSAHNTRTFTFTHTLLWYYESLWVFAENVRVDFYVQTHRKHSGELSIMSSDH